MKAIHLISSLIPLGILISNYLLIIALQTTCPQEKKYQEIIEQLYQQNLAISHESDVWKAYPDLREARKKLDLACDLVFQKKCLAGNLAFNINKKQVQEIKQLNKEITKLRKEAGILLEQFEGQAEAMIFPFLYKIKYQ